MKQVTQNFGSICTTLLLVLSLAGCGADNAKQIEKANKLPVDVIGALYVSPEGNDAYPGTKGKPFATLRRACELAQSGNTIYLRRGEYTETLTPTQSGLPNAPITISRYADEKVILVSGQLITDWTEVGNGVYGANSPVDLGMGMNQLVCNGELMVEARTPNIEDQNELVHVFGLHKALAAFSEENSVCAVEPTVELQTEEPVHYVGRHGGAWGAQTALGTFNETGTMNILAKTNKGYSSWWKGKGEGYVVGAKKYLDHGREWYLDRKNKKIYFIPPQGTNPHQMKIYIKDRPFAIDLKDRKHIVVDGVRTLMGTVRMENSENCTLRNSDLLYGGHHTFFDNPYTYEGDVSSKCGVYMTGSKNVIERCQIAWNSAASILLGGEDNRVLNSRVHDSGLLGSYYSGIYVFQQEKLAGGGHEIARNTLYNLGRGAIHMSSIGGWGNPGKYAKPLNIHHNHISGAMMVCDDGGAIYQFCTDGAGSQLHHNWVFGTKGCMIYFDNHSFGWFVHHNIIQGDVNLNAPADRIHIYNNTMLLTHYGISKYFWFKENFVSNNIDPYFQDNATWDGATCNGVRPPYVVFAGEGTGGLKYRAKEIRSAGLPKVKPRVASVTGNVCPQFSDRYFGAYEYGVESPEVQKPWIAGCDWGDAIPKIPHRKEGSFSVQASSFSKSEALQNNALFVSTTGNTAWARYDKLDFSAGYSHVILNVMLEEDCPEATIELRRDKLDGECLAQSSLKYRNTEKHQFFFEATKLKSVGGQHDIYLVIHSEKKLNLAQFILTGAEKTPLYKISPQKLIEVNGNKKIEKTAYEEGSKVLLMTDNAYKHPGIWMTGSFELMGCRAGSWVFFPNVDFGSGRQQLRLNMGSSKYDDPTARVELRSGEPHGQLIGTLELGKIGEDIWQERIMEIKNISGVHDLFVVFPKGFSSGLNYILFP